MAEYTFDLAWERERERMGAGETLFDPFTSRIFDEIGVSEGWRCFEIGAGGGTMAAWLCERVGPSGEVLAIDLDTRFVERLDYPNLEVRHHDISTGPVDGRTFDLIHARLLLEHVATRSEVVKELVEILNPGGWLFLEDFDLTEQPHLPPEAYFLYPADPEQLLARTTQAMCDLLREFGVMVDYGRALPAELLSNGLEDVDARYQTQLIHGGTPRADFSRLMFEFLRDELIARGLATEDEIQTVIERHTDPGYAWMSVPMFSAWGRKPRS